MQPFAASSLRHDWPRTLHIPSICLHAALWSPGSPPTYRICTRARIFAIFIPGSPSFQDHCSFLGSHLSGFLFFPAAQASNFPKLNSLVQKHNIWSASSLLVLSQACLLIGGFMTLIGWIRICHYFLVHILPEFTIRPQWLQLFSKEQASAWELESSISDIHTTQPLICQLCVLTA